MISAKRIADLPAVNKSVGQLADVCMMIHQEKLPQCMEIWMVAVPAERILRSAHGVGDLGLVRLLLWAAIRRRSERLREAVADFWRYRILLQNPEAVNLEGEDSNGL